MLTRTVQQYLTSRRTLVPALLGLALLLAMGLSARGSYAADMLLQPAAPDQGTRLPTKGEQASEWDRAGEPGIPSLFGGGRALPGGAQGTVGEVARPEAPPCSPDWSLVASPNRVSENSQLLCISGSSANDVLAVGYFEDALSGGRRTLIEHWNGTEWVRVPSYNEGMGENILNGVVAVSPTDVWAVGSYYQTSASRWRSLVLRWNGYNWFRVSTPIVPGFRDELFSVSKRDGNNVWAVGYYEPTSGDRQALAMRWTGTEWSLSYPPNPGGAARDNVLTSVSVVPGSSGNDVWAAGYYDDGTDYRTLVVHWNGSSWSHVPSTNPGASSDNFLMGVSALGTNDVWFSGYYGGLATSVPFTLRWTGSSFTTQTIPSTGTGAQLFQIAALASNNVWSVGYYYGGGPSAKTLVVRWDGTSWNIVPSADPGHASGLLAVTAIDASNIWAAYIYTPEAGAPSHTLIERFDGSSFVQTPSPNGPTDVNALLGVSARTFTDVWAVGASASDLASASTLVQHWDGTAWNIVRSENVGGMSVLQDVVAISESDGWAVGFSGPTPQRTLIERYNSDYWSPVPSPNVGPDDNELRGVSAASANDVWAVGSYNDGTAERTLILHWDGTSWSVVPSPNPGGSSVDNILESVTVVPGTMGAQAWAVGRTDGLGVTPQAIILGWNGSTWEAVTLTPTDGPSELLDVHAGAHDEVWAVGYTTFWSGTSRRTRVMRYDGTTWREQKAPNRSAGDNTLYSVVAVAPDEMWAAGSDGDQEKTLLMHFDGSDFSFVSSPSPGGMDRILDLAAVSPQKVWGVGRTRALDTSSPTWGFQTLVMQLNHCLCTTEFNDAPPGSPFYENVRCLACRDILSGYGCGATGEPCPGNYFRPNANVTRGQAAKIIANAAGYTDAIPSSKQTFRDVPPDSPFWLFIERVYAHGAISGYACGGPGEPCPGAYFRPGNNLTRGQLAKISTEVAGYSETPSGQSFNDVPPDSPFYVYIERARLHEVISGYACGDPGEPCPGAYFRPGNNVTRGQTAKIISNTFYPACVTPARP